PRQQPEPPWRGVRAAGPSRGGTPPRPAGTDPVPCRRLAPGASQGAQQHRLVPCPARRSPQAPTHCRQSLALQRDLGDRWGEALTLDTIGYAHHLLGHQKQAIAYYQQSLGLKRELGHRYPQATTLSHLGDTHHATGDLDAPATPGNRLWTYSTISASPPKRAWAPATPTQMSSAPNSPTSTGSQEAKRHVPSWEPVGCVGRVSPSGVPDRASETILGLR